MRNLIRGAGPILVCVLAAAPARGADRYVTLTAARPTIHEAPLATSAAVAQGRKGDVFKLAQEKDGWYEVLLFSGAGRFVPVSQARLTAYSPSAPPDLVRRRELFRALSRAQNRAVAEADKTHPPNGSEPNLAQQRLLDDRYKLEAIRRLGVQPPVYELIRAEAAQANWR